MADIKDGGPAFPRIDVEHFPSGYGHGEHCETQSKAGMSLRDYFAAMAMCGSLGGEPGPHLTPTRLAEESYAHADAMLKAREATHA